MADLASRKLAGLILFLLSWISFSISGVYPEDGPVLVLDEDKYKEIIEGYDTVWMLEYFQEDCAACMMVSPEYSKAANNLKGIVKVAAVDCKATPMICGHMGIKTLPAIKLFPWERKKNPYTGSFYKDAPATFEGPMPFTSKQIVEFAQGALPSQFVEIVSSSNGSAEAFITKKSKAPAVLLVSSKAVVTPVFKALSLQFRGRLRFAQASSSDAKIVEATGATTFPSLFVLKGEKEYVKYEGALKAEPIAEFLSGHALDSPEEEEEVVASKEGKGSDGAGEGAGGKEEDKVGRPSVEGKDFEKTVLQSEDVFLVAFLNRGVECAGKVKAWEGTLKSIIGMAEIGELDITSDPEALKWAERYGVRSQAEDTSKCMGVLLFEFGDEKSDSEPKVYGGELEGKALSAFLFEALPDVFVHRLTSASFPTFTSIEYMKPKMVLMTQKKEVPGMFKALSTRFRREMLFGMVHESEKELLQQFKAEKLPQVSVIMTVQSKANPGKYDAQVQNYQGPLKFNALAYFCYQVLQATGGLKQTTKLKEITDDASFQEACTNKDRLCAIGFFRGDSASIDEQKAWLVESAVSVGGASGPYLFMWVDVNKHDAFARQFDVLKGHAPTVAIISPRKLRTAVLRESYSKQSVTSFVSNLLSGGVTTSPISELPSFTKGSAKSDEPEPDEEAPIVEEEFNLDDIMGEEIEDSGALGSKEKRLEEVERELREAEEAKKKAEEEAAQAAKKSKKKKKKSKKSKKDEL